ncbi:hypothetical protein MSC49_32500 [Methylosinus sp. C49]|nr:hypothetical protein [Methylosinus sp. C49]BBU63315.1 hypothetical protein MSC49_32500 [Methylosinus sp. C49]
MEPDDGVIQVFDLGVVNLTEGAAESEMKALARNGMNEAETRARRF